jgi:hypothetical protein
VTGFVQDAEESVIMNDEFRQVLYAARDCSLVVPALTVNEAIGAKVEKFDSFFRAEQGHR